MKPKKIAPLLPIITKQKAIYIEPQPDLCICQECRYKGKSDQFIYESDGCWETGYCAVQVCPDCGGVAEPSMSPRQNRKWNEWYTHHQALEVHLLVI